MEEELIVYKHWITGEEYTHKLGFSHPGEQKTELLCPLDSTPLIFQYDDISKVVYCPNCEIIYPSTGNQEIINNSFEKHLEKLKEKLVNIEKEKKNIEFLLNRVRQNKANLSANIFTHGGRDDPAMKDYFKMLDRMEIENSGDYGSDTD